jgi:fructose-bisphosphate aldolase class I
VIQANTQLMALFAASCVRAGLVPVLIVDVRDDGHHDAWESAAVSACVFDGLFSALRAGRVSAAQIVLGTGMAVEGRGSETRADPRTVGAATAQALAAVPSHLGGLSYLCDGGRLSRAVQNLRESRRARAPWPGGFVVGRAASEVVMAIWRGQASETDRAREALLERLRLLCEARPDRSSGPKTGFGATAGASPWRHG